MKVAIVTHTSFPEGLAPTNRVIYHAKGLKENGVDVKIFITLPTENWRRVKNTQVDGEIMGIPYKYVWNETKRSKFFIGRRIHDLLTPIKTVFTLRKEKYETVLLISFCSYYVAFILNILCLIFRIKLIAERTELPKTEKGFLELKNKIMIKFVLKKLYGFLTISKNLKNYYPRYLSKGCPVVLIPVLIDVNDIYKKDIHRTRNLVYTGPLHQKKDGIITLIQAFKTLAPEFPETNLILTGDINFSPDKAGILAELTPDIKDRIELKGFVTRKEMIELINSAAGLLLAKPSSDQADTCFPTKLGEYLATGNPILVTRTGEIPFYLKDGESAYIAEPDSLESFTSKMRDLLSNTEKAKVIGENGKKVAEKSFNAKEISKKVIKLIEDRNYFLTHE